MTRKAARLPHDWRGHDAMPGLHGNEEFDGPVSLSAVGDVGDNDVVFRAERRDLEDPCEGRCGQAQGCEDAGTSRRS